jgi:hypothetical protein
MDALARQGLMMDFPQRQGIYALRKQGNSDLLANHRANDVYCIQNTIGIQFKPLALFCIPGALLGSAQ